jgi:hypothetical protein
VGQDGYEYSGDFYFEKTEYFSAGAGQGGQIKAWGASVLPDGQNQQDTKGRHTPPPGLAFPSDR